MYSNKFWNLLTQYIEIPFDIDDVTSIENNTGTVFITLKNGDTYWVDCQKCEACDDITKLEV